MIKLFEQWVNENKITLGGTTNTDRGKIAYNKHKKVIDKIFDEIGKIHPLKKLGTSAKWYFENNEFRGSGNLRFYGRDMFTRKETENFYLDYDSKGNWTVYIDWRNPIKIDINAKNTSELTDEDLLKSWKKLKPVMVKATTERFQKIKNRAKGEIEYYKQNNPHS